MVGAVDKHLALIGFMGAGKSKLGRELARLTRRPFVDTDEEIEKRFGPIGELFERGEPEFRRIEEQIVAEALAGPTAVIALGGGAVLSEATRERLAQTAFVTWVPVEVDTAWSRVSRSDRPLARDREAFGRLFEERAPIYDEVAEGAGQDAQTLLLSSLGIVFSGRVPYEAAVIADERVAGLHEFPGPALSTHPVPSGEAAKTIAVVERLWSELEIGRDGWIVGFGGGSTTDVAGFVAATHLRGSPLGRRADDARGHGRRSHWRKDRDQHRGRKEPGRRVPLPAAGLRRPGLPHDASRRGAASRDGRGREDRAPRRRRSSGSSRRTR